MTSVGITTSEEFSGEPDPAAVAAESRVGELLNGKWRLDAVLGVGGSAAVYAATHRSGERAAIKLLHAEYAFHERLRFRLGCEAQVLRALNHPGAVRLLEEGVCNDGELFLAMELLEGETLSQYVLRKEARVERSQALLIGLLLLDAVIALHARGVVHRDLTLDNVFITRSGELKLIDFGISRLLSQAQSEAAGEVGLVVGTPGFMAPEQARGQNRQVDRQSDVWAVGALLFELLTGLPVHFQAHTLAEKLSLAASMPAPKLCTVDPHASPALQGLVDRALAFEKQQRFDDARQMHEALFELYVWGSAGPPPQASSQGLSAPALLAAAPSAFERSLNESRRPPGMPVRVERARSTLWRGLRAALRRLVTANQPRGRRLLSVASEHAAG